MIYIFFFNDVGISLIGVPMHNTTCKVCYIPATCVSCGGCMMNYGYLRWRLSVHTVCKESEEEPGAQNVTPINTLNGSLLARGSPLYLPRLRRVKHKVFMSF